MNKDTERKARAESTVGHQIVDLRARVPEMDSKSLANLRANAERLAASGSERQKAAAGDLLPVIDAELAKRAEAAAAAKPAKKTRKTVTG
jgi:uncharacterized protein YciI